MTEDIPTGLIDPSTGQPLTKHTLNPQRVEERVKKRSLHEYENASKKMLRYANFGRRNHWPINITDDMVFAAMLLAEVYIAKREGIIKDA